MTSSRRSANCWRSSMVPPATHLQLIAAEARRAMVWLLDDVHAVRQTRNNAPIANFLAEAFCLRFRREAIQITNIFRRKLVALQPLTYFLQMICHRSLLWLGEKYELASCVCQGVILTTGCLENRARDVTAPCN